MKPSIMHSKEISLLHEWIITAKRIVFFGGAGVSTASNIPDFRSENGLYQDQTLNVETILSHRYFMTHTDAFYQFYKDKMVYQDAKPNAVHDYLAKLELSNKNMTVITQNIDGLHQLAGSKNVKELHGSIWRSYCMQCHKFFPLENVLSSESVPKCSCGGVIKPDVVLYEEPLNRETMNQAIQAIEQTDLLIVGGTSLSVYPAAGLLQYFKGTHLVLLNKTTTPYDHLADLIIRLPIEQVFSSLHELGE